jgi:hypothetical protein
MVEQVKDPIKAADLVFQNLKNHSAEGAAKAFHDAIYSFEMKGSKGASDEAKFLKELTRQAEDANQQMKKNGFPELHIVQDGEYLQASFTDHRADGSYSQMDVDFTFTQYTRQHNSGHHEMHSNEFQSEAPKLDNASKTKTDSIQPQDADSQVIADKLAPLIPAGVHLKFTPNSFAPDKYVDPKHWAPIENAVKNNPDLVNAIRHKMGSTNHLEIASSHETPSPQIKDTHGQSTPDKDGVFKFNAAVNDLKAGAQAYTGKAQEAYEPMYLGGHVVLNGQDIRIDPSANMPIPAEAKDGYPIGARLMQNSAGIQSMRGVLHTAGNAKYFRVQRIDYANKAPDTGQSLVDIPLTTQDKNGVARYR